MSKNQAQVDALKNLTWLHLESLFDRKLKRRPPLYFFLSPESKGSLRKRTSDEKALVHRQQMLKQGITLIDPPSAWVSRLDQTCEEAAHLFALVQKPWPKRFMPTPQAELTTMILHEAFARFSVQILNGFNEKPLKARKKKSSNVWEQAHRDGYILGHALAQGFLEEKISRRKLQKWFEMNWYARGSRALQFLRSLAK